MPTRTTTWDAPADAVQRGLALGGLAYLRAMFAGELPLPPIMATVGFAPETLEEGRVVFAADPGEHLLNPIGTVHGGFAATLLDSALGCAVHSTLPPGTAYTSLGLELKFLRPVTPASGRVLAEGRVVHPGRRVATAEGRLVQAGSGRLLATATTTCLVLAAPAG